MKPDCLLSSRTPVTPGRIAVVVGAGKSGEAAARLLGRLGARVRLLEKNPANVSPEFAAEAREHGWEILTGPHAPEHFANAALVVPCPGVPLTVLRPLLEQAGNPPLMAELELASRFTEKPVIAITGTSGKTTTASLTAAMLREAGRTVFLGGNIGTPLSSYILAVLDGAEKEADVLVLEVSSFQLMGVSSFHPRVAVLLNLSPNHLDQHKDFTEYRDAKFRLFAAQTEEDTAIFGRGLEDEARRRGIRATILGFAPSARFPKTLLLGDHNQANLEAAFLAAHKLGVDEHTAAKAVEAFAPLPNRLEIVGEWDGRQYINDSKATTPDALEVALRGMARPVRLLAGGVYKGGDLTRLLPLIREKVTAIGLFGAHRDVFEKAWTGAAPINWFPSLEEAMRCLRKEMRPGEVMLLSPATASFDLYKNYEQRGEDFRRIARQLQ